MNEFDICLVFTAGSAPRSKMLRWADRSPISHVGIEYYSKIFKEHWLLEANCFGVQTIPRENIEYETVRKFRLKINGDRGLRALRKLIGNSYDYRGAFLIMMLRVLKRLLGIKMGNPRRTTDSYFCSDLIANFFSLLELPLCSFWNPKDVTPHDIYLYCLRHPELFEEIS